MNGSANFDKVGVVSILLEKIELGRLTPRKTFDERYVDELAESIDKEGQFKPIIVRLHPLKKSMFEVIDGEHRVRALRRLGRLYIRAEIRILSDEEADILAMRVNQMHGKRLNELEEGLHIKGLMERYGRTQEQVAESFNRSQQWVSQRLRLAIDSCNELIQAITTRVVNPTIAREVTELPKQDQPEVLEKIIKDKLSSRETALLVKSIKEHPDKKEDVLSRPIVELTSPLMQ